MGKILDVCCCTPPEPPLSCDEAYERIPTRLYASLASAQCSLLNQTVPIDLIPHGSEGGPAWQGCLAMQPCASNALSTFGWVPVIVSLKCCFTGMCRLGGPGGLLWSLRLFSGGCGNPLSCGEPDTNDPCALGGPFGGTDSPAVYQCSSTCLGGGLFMPPYNGTPLLCGSCSGNAFDCLSASYSPLFLAFKWIFNGGLFANSTWGTCSTDTVHDGFFHPCCESGGFGTGEIDGWITE